jgi:hypothetical protein
MDSDFPSQPPVKIDTTVPVSARIWNYWLGGKWRPDHTPFGPPKT